MNEHLQRPFQRRALTPLWVIALFISLTETVLGVGVIQTTGGIQIALTTFVLSFPLLIAITFFLTLWKRPWVLYAPTEYGSGTNVGDYVREMSGRQKSLDELQIYSQIQQSIREALTSEQIINELDSLTIESVATQEAVKSILSEAAESAGKEIRNKAFITIDTQPFDRKNGRAWTIPYDRYDNVSDLLDDVYFTLDGVPPYTYGKRWILCDRTSGRGYGDMGKSWAIKHNEEYDNRSLKEVGIKPGMILDVKPVETV